MANLFQIKLEILMLFISFIVISRGYERLSIGDNCLSIFKQNSIHLGKGDLSGLLVSLGDIRALKENENKKENDFICEFRINKFKKDKGIFVVIQNIFFRKNHTTQECIDYVEYRGNFGSISKKYCGQMGIDYKFQANDSHVINNSYVELAAHPLHVYINISKTSLKPDENLKLEVLFTSFRTCFKKNMSEYQQCIPGRRSLCIYKGFFNDGYVNCPFPGCGDEPECPREFQDRMGPSVAIIILVVGIFIILLFVFGILIGYKVRQYLIKNSVRSSEDIVATSYRNEPFALTLNGMETITFTFLPHDS